MMSNHTKPTKQQAPAAVKQLLWCGFVGFIFYIPLHILLAQSLSQITGGLEVWKVAKDAVLIIAALAATVLLWPRLKRTKSLRILAWVSLGYGLIHLLFLLIADLDGKTALLASVYNNRLTMLLVVGLAAGYWYKNRAKDVGKYLLIISSMVAVFGLIQYLLPADFMERLGYSLERGTRPFFGIDDKVDLPRAFSTIRDPNSLGAFLIISLALISAYYFKARSFVERKKWFILLLLQGAVLVLTFSRSAWLGALLAVAIVAYNSPRIRAIFTPKRLFLVACSLFLAAVLLFSFARDSYLAENIIFHSDETTAEVGSTEKHVNHLRESITEVVQNPLGYGPGTAGLVSIHNPNGTNLTENYYLQIGHEVGVLGLALFIALNALVYSMLVKSAPGPLRAALIASFWGLVITNMLLHSWSNEAVAVWWLLAGYQAASSN